MSKEIIKSIEEFGNLNEGIFKSFFKGLGNIFTQKESRIEPILKKIKKAKEESVSNQIETEKNIWEIGKINTPEARFQLNNINRQSRIYISLKEQEIDSLVKEAEKIIDKNPKLSAFFNAELAKIHATSIQRLIKNIKPYKESSYLDNLNKEFDALVKDANKKANFYEEYKETEDYFPGEELIRDTDEEILKFIDMSNSEAASLLRTYSNDKIEKLYRNLKSLLFTLEIEYQKSNEAIKKDIKRAEKEGQDWFVVTLENQARELKYHMKKPIEKIRYKISIIEKEKRTRKYELSHKTE